jgi:hypothetical protein
MSSPFATFVEWLSQCYQQSPIGTVLVGLVVLASGVALIRKALKFAVALIVLAVLAIASSSVLQGVDETQEDLEKVVDRISEEVKEQEQLPGQDH